MPHNENTEVKIDLVLRMVVACCALLILLPACQAEPAADVTHMDGIRSSPKASATANQGTPADTWVAKVAQRAGFEVLPTEGGAPEIFREPSSFRMWAFVPEEQQNRRAVLRKEGYQHVGTQGGIELFSDGQRLTWEINGIYVWLSGVTGIDASTLGVIDLVQAATEFAWDGGPSGEPRSPSLDG